MSNVIQTPRPDEQLTQIRPFASFRTFNDLISYVNQQKSVLAGNTLSPAQKRDYATTLVQYLNQWEGQIVEAANGKIETIQRKSGRNVAASLLGGGSGAVASAVGAGLLATSTALPIIGAALGLAAGVAKLIQNNTIKQLQKQLEDLKVEATRLDTLRKEIQAMVPSTSTTFAGGNGSSTGTPLILILVVIVFFVIK